MLEAYRIVGYHGNMNDKDFDDIELLFSSNKPVEKKKPKIFTEHKSIATAMRNKDPFFISERVLLPIDIDFTDNCDGKFKALLPVSINNVETGRTDKGWLCFTPNEKYQIVYERQFIRSFNKTNCDILHFGIPFSSKLNKFNKLDRDFFFEKYEIKSSGLPLVKIDRITKNFDNNIQYFGTLDQLGFENEVNHIVNQFHFEEVSELLRDNNCLYMMVFDEYKQFYIGKCDYNLRNRIRSHWSAFVDPYHQIWTGGEEDSRLSVDNFGAFDNTRIFVCKNPNQILEENPDLANNMRIARSNLFVELNYDELSKLEKAERIVIINCLCAYCLSDRLPILSYSKYEKLAKSNNCKKEELTIKQFLYI